MKINIRSALALLIMAALCILPLTTINHTAIAAPSVQTGNPALTLTAQSALVMDCETGDILFEKDANTQRAPASITKIMTLLLAVEAGNLSRMVTIPNSASTAPSDSTVVPVYVDERMTMNDLLHGMFIKSGNDASNAIGTVVAGSVAEFVNRMNERAKNLGMKNTRFANTHGYPVSGHYTTARDMAILTRHAMQNPTVKKIATMRQYTMAPTEKRSALQLKKSYAILDPASEYYDARVIGLKTGYSQSSGQCFVGAATKNGKTLICVILKSGWAKPDKWIDAKRLFDFGFQNV